MGSSAGDPAPYSNTVRIGYARVSGRTQDHQLQLDALAAADCRDIVIETASTRTDRPQLRQALAVLKPGDTLVIYKPDRVARSMKELLVLLEDQLHAREINLHILTGICAGLHRPTGATIADKMLFMVAALWPRRWNATSSANAPSTAWPPPTPKAAAAATHPLWTPTPSPSPSPAAPAANPSPASPGTSASEDPPSTGHSANLTPPETDPPTHAAYRRILFR